MSTKSFIANRLREFWDDDTRTYTRWDETGAQVEQRPYTPDENARVDAEAAITTANTNRTSLRAKAINALANNATFLGLSSPTNAQVVAQTKALTRQNNALIRLVIGQLDDTSGT